MKLNSKFSKTAKTSAETVAASNDLVTEIFLLLPMKTLIRFQSVSKHWNSVISDPKFYFLRNRDLNNPAVGLICQEYNRHWFAKFVPFDKSSYRAPFIKLDFIKEANSARGIRILHSCNGLLVCCNNDHNIWRFYICNPTTMKYKTLPKLDFTLTETIDWAWMCLAFDPSKSPHYKVVCVLKSKRITDQHQFEVYSSETGSWERRGETFKARVDFRNGVYWHGAIHWISFSKNEKSIYFNPDDDQMPRVMPMPTIPDWRDGRSDHYFGESCGHLHFVHQFWSGCTVYEMERDYSEWLVKYRVDLSNVVGNTFPICALVRGDKDEDSFLVLRKIGRTIIRYNVVCKTSETLHDLAYPCAQDPLPYIVSLCSV